MPKLVAIQAKQKPNVRCISGLPVGQNNSELSIVIVVFVLAIASRNVGRCGDGQVWRVVCTETH
jgi:hypothetical protein